MADLAGKMRDGKESLALASERTVTAASSKMENRLSRRILPRKANGRNRHKAEKGRNPARGRNRRA